MKEDYKLTKPPPILPVNSKGEFIVRSTKDRVSEIYWTASERYEGLGKEFVRLFKREFIRLCRQDGII